MARYTGAANLADAATALVVNEAGQIIVTGASAERDTGTDFTTIKYDSDGSVLWLDHFDYSPGDFPHTLALNSAGEIFVAGTVGSSFGSAEWRFNGADVPGATNATLLLEHVQPENAGEYSVEVSNSAASFISQTANLTVVSAGFSQFTSLALAADKDLRLTLAGTRGFQYILETSTNLKDWKPLTRLFSADGRWNTVSAMPRVCPSAFIACDFCLEEPRRNRLCQHSRTAKPWLLRSGRRNCSRQRGT